MSILQIINNIAALIPDNATIVLDGCMETLAPKYLLEQIRSSFLTTGHPRNLTIWFTCGLQALDLLAAPGLLRRVIGSYWALTPRLTQMALSGQLDGYNLPQGVLASLMSSTSDFYYTQIGLDTFVDPKLEGGKLNPKSPDLVTRVTINNKTFLKYPVPRPDVCLIRAGLVDKLGNTSFKFDPIKLVMPQMARLTKNNHGTVIVQAGRITNKLNQRDIDIPSDLIDYVVPASNSKYNRMSASFKFNKVLLPNSNHVSIINAAPVTQLTPLQEQLAKRVASLITPSDHVINFGIGQYPMAVSQYLRQNNSQIIPSVESGVFGGVPLSAPDFGVSLNPMFRVDTETVFNFYHQGLLDAAVLGFGQIDELGQVNVSHLGRYVSGIGGFLDICLNTPKLIFVGTEATPKGHKKLVKRVHQVSYRVRDEQKAYLVTEKHVYQVTPHGARVIN